MKIKILLHVLIGVMMLAAVMNAVAKRMPPKEVEPIIYQDVKYVATPHARMGYVEAWDQKTRKKLWELKIYTIKYKHGLETDVQDVFITSLAIKDGRLIVANERNEIYEIDLQTKGIVKVK